MEPEILDELPADDPRAIRSRRDLRVINFLMGSERWILRQVRAHQAMAENGVVELGAGRGDLLRKLGRFGPASGVDLTPRPADLPAGIGWIEGDVFERSAELSGGILVANLFLHHFLDDGLARIGGLAQNFELLVINEPFRHEHTLWKADTLTSLVGETTRHDMPVSIRAGFAKGELPRLLGLDPGKWQITERSTWRGGQRLLARQRGSQASRL